MSMGEVLVRGNGCQTYGWSRGNGISSNAVVGVIAIINLMKEKVAKRFSGAASLLTIV